MEPEIIVQEQQKPKNLTKAKSVVPTDKREENKKSIEWQRARDSEMVRGKFLNLEQPGAPLSFPYKAYPGDKVEIYHFQHGEIKEIPLGVAMHLSDNCGTPIYEYVNVQETRGRQMVAGVNPDKNNNMRITGVTPRFSFTPVNFSQKDYFGGTSNKVLKVERVDGY